MEKLDPGLSKRPSRVDRKYHFSNPSFEDRVRYCEYWRCVYPQFVPSKRSPNPKSSKKLSSRPAATTPPTVPYHIASITDGFSFAYLKEVYVASLLILVQSSAQDIMAAEEEGDPQLGTFGSLLQQQAVALRKDIVD